jgi:hypothetical protein
VGSDDDRPLPAAWAAPDDARELELDLVAWRREQRARERKRRVALLVRRPVVRAALLGTAVLLAIFGVGLVLLGPAITREGVGARPLASSTVSPGRVGALLPDVPVRVGGETRSVRTLRPAAIAVVPARCGCRAAAHALGAAARQYGVSVVVAVRAALDAAPLLAAAAPARAFAAVDARGALADAYAASGVTVLLVRADGVVSTVARDVDADTDLRTALAELAS